MTDPELKGRDPMWRLLFSGKAHVYYALPAIIVLCVAVDCGGSPRLAAIAAALAVGVFVDLWAHQYMH